MAKIEKFEDIKAWQKARILVRKIYKVSAYGNFARDYGLRDQIRRAVVSIMGNIAEGFGRRSNQEFANFLNYSHGSAAEVQSHLYVALDIEYIQTETFNTLYNLCDETSRMILSLENYVRTHNTY